MFGVSSNAEGYGGAGNLDHTIADANLYSKVKKAFDLLKDQVVIDLGASTSEVIHVLTSAVGAKAYVAIDSPAEINKRRKQYQVALSIFWQEERQ